MRTYSRHVGARRCGLVQAALILGGLIVSSFSAPAALATLICTGDVSGTAAFCGQSNAASADIVVGGASGASTNGSLQISGGSVLTTPTPAPSGRIANTATSSGTVTVTGAGSAWIIDGAFENDPENDGFGGSLIIGRRGDGTLNVLDGGTVEVGAAAGTLGPSVFVGGTAGGSGTGTALVNGAGSNITVRCLSCNDPDASPIFTVGRQGVGTMDIENGGALVIDGFNAFLSIARGEGPAGNPATGTLNVSQGSITINATTGTAEAVIGRNLGDSGALTLADDSQMTVSGADARIHVGRDGTGTMNVLSGSSVRIEGLGADDTGMQISNDGNGDGAAGAGTVIVDDASLTVAAENSFINIGDEGSGAMTVRNGGVVSVAGDGGFGFIGVGRSGTGTLQILDGGEVDVTSTVGDASVFVAEAPGSVGTVVVDGAGSRLDAGETLAVGLRFGLTDPGGTGTLSVRNGGRIVADEIYIGANGFLGGRGVVAGSIFNIGGTVGPGLSPGLLTVDGDYTQSAGILEIEIAGLGDGEFDVLDVTGLASFSGGAIRFSFLDDFLPQAGDVIDFLLASSIVGLDTLDFLYQGAAPGFEFQLSGVNGGLSFVALNDATAVPEPASLILLLAGLVGLLCLDPRRHSASRLERPRVCG